MNINGGEMVSTWCEKLRVHAANGNTWLDSVANLLIANDNVEYEYALAA